MNIADIEKVSNRKRINVEADNLREKVKHETENIIKLKVAQDTAYWDLKEKLHQLENNHERLQQNMVEVQMQHEAISGQYQDELRLRPETLNKLSSTREICDVLEEYSERLKATVTRCKADQVTLAEAYNKSGQLVRDLKVKQIQVEEKNQQVIDNLQERAKLLSDHKEQLTQMFNTSKQQLEIDLSEARSKLATALGQKDELFVALTDLSRKLDHCKRELEKKEENIANLQMDMNKLINEFANQANEMKNVLAKQEINLKESTENNESLKKALNNQEQFTQSVCEHNNKLQEKISSLEEEKISIEDKVKELESQLKDSHSQYDKLIKDMAIFNEKKEDLEKEMILKISLLEQAEIDKGNLTEQISALEVKINQLALELETAHQESVLKSEKIDDLNSTVQLLETKNAELETLKAHNAKQFIELNHTLDSKDKELDSKTSTINQLMSDLKIGTDTRIKLETNIEKMKKEIESEKENTKEKEKCWGKKVEQLEIVVRDKENELSKQMMVILDMRNEKERMQQRLNGMQNTIDNIQKEVTGGSQLPPREAAELDDNAVMLTPAQNLRKIPVKKMSQPSLEDTLPPKIQRTLEFTAPHQQSKQLDSMIFSLFSDSSMESESIDPHEVNRRFDALSRGERLSPMPFKRRNGAPLNMGGLKPVSDNQPKENAKQKRIFFKSKRPDIKAKKTKPDA